ncbi:MAG: TetR/AcrR family transcriptional regulator [Albidovulum sp.]
MARTSGSNADVTRPRIRAAALALFARHGYAAVSMRQIAAQVGVQAGALYNYVPDKQSLLFDLMRQHMQDLLASYDETAPMDGDANLRLDHFVRHHIGFHLDRVDQVFVAYMELRNLEPRNFVAIEDLRRAYEGRLEDVLAAGAAAGAFRLADLRVTTMALIALLTGVTNWYRKGGRLPMAKIEAIYLDLARKALAA